MKFVKSIIFTFITNIFGLATVVVTSIFISRLLGAQGRGVISLSNNLISFAILFLSFGLTAANVYYTGLDNDKIDEIMGVNLIFIAISTIIILIAYFLNNIYNFKIFNGLDNKLLIVVLITIPIMLLKTFFTNIILGLQKISLFNKVNIFDRTVSLILLIIFLLIFKDAFWILLSNLITNFILVLVLLYYLFFIKRVKVTLKKEIFKNMIKYGFKAQIGNIIQMINYRLDVFIINYYLPISQVGIYSNAVSLGETMWQVGSSVSTVIFPMASNSKDKLDMRHFINKVTRVTIFFVGTIAIVLALVSRWLVVFLFGKEFLMSATALVFILPGIVLFSIAKIISNYLSGIGYVEKNIIASTISCIATVLLDVSLIPTIGIVGASIASSISYSIFTLIILYYYMQITKSNLLDIIVIKGEDFRDIFIRLKFYFSKVLKVKIV